MDPKLTLKQQRLIKSAVRGERVVLEDDYCLRDERGLYHLLAELEFGAKLLGRRMMVTGRPRVFTVAYDHDNETAELWNEWTDLDGWMLDQQAFRNEPEKELFLAGWDIGDDGKPAATEIFTPKAAAELMARVQE